MNYLTFFRNNKKNPNNNSNKGYNHNDYGESFSLTDDRAKLLPSFGSLRALNEFKTSQQNPSQKLKKKPDGNGDDGPGGGGGGGVLSERSEHSWGIGYTSLDTSQRGFQKRDRRGSEKEQQYGDDDDDGSERNGCIAVVPVDGFGHRVRRKTNTRYRFLQHCITILGYISVISFTLMILIVPILLRNQPKSEWCRIYQNNHNHCSSQTSQTNNHNNCTDTNNNNNHNQNFASPTFPSQTAEYENPNFDTDPCRYIRIPHLFYLTLEEADHCCRLLASVLMGFAIGYERRISDRPAGIRTMGLVSLGSCFFTIGSIAAFRSSTMGWDASRVSAAIPSGVGFLGAGLIWKGNVGEGQNANHQVHGLTTAASVWLSAAAGVGVGGHLYFVSGYSMILIMIILRYGPTISLYFDSNDDNDEYDDSNDEYDNYSDDVLSKCGGGLKPNGLDSTDERYSRMRRRSLMNPRQGPSKSPERNAVGVEMPNNRSFDSCTISSNQKVTESNKNVEHLQTDDCTDNYYKINAEEMIMFQRWKECQMTQSSAKDTKLPRHSASCGDGKNVVESPDESDSWKNNREEDRNNNDDCYQRNNRNGHSLTEGRDFMKAASIASEETGSEYMETQVPICSNNDSDRRNDTKFYSSDPCSFDSASSRASDLSYEST